MSVEEFEESARHDGRLARRRVFLTTGRKSYRSAPRDAKERKEVRR